MYFHTALTFCSKSFANGFDDASHDISTSCNMYVFVLIYFNTHVLLVTAASDESPYYIFKIYQKR